jgi:hypothetical protein
MGIHRKSTTKSRQTDPFMLIINFKRSNKKNLVPEATGLLLSAIAMDPIGQ